MHLYSMINIFLGDQHGTEYIGIILLNSRNLASTLCQFNSLYFPKKDIHCTSHDLVNKKLNIVQMCI